MCFGGGGGSGKASLSQLRQGRGMAVQRSGTTNYTDYDYSGVKAYAGQGNKKAFNYASSQQGATIQKNTMGGLSRNEARAAGVGLFRGAIPRGKLASFDITDAASYNAAIDSGAFIKGQAKATTKQANLGRTAVADESRARIASRKARTEVANVNDQPTKKAKKRGGLRLDRSTGTNSTGSGVYIPK